MENNEEKHIVTIEFRNTWNWRIINKLFLAFEKAGFNIYLGYINGKYTVHAIPKNLCAESIEFLDKELLQLDLERAKKTIEEETLFTCFKCGRQFRTKQALTAHKYQETKKKVKKNAHKN